MAFRVGPEAGQGEDKETETTSTKNKAGLNSINCIYQ